MTESGARQRFAPDVPMPRAAFLPGRMPRPPRAEFALDPALCAPERWRENQVWLHGADLYNHGFAWECHEAWEHVWRSASDPRQRLFLQALIQCAASALKRALGEMAGSMRLAERAVQNLDGLASEIAPRYMGLDHRAFATRFRAFGASADAGFDDRPRLRLE